MTGSTNIYITRKAKRLLERLAAKEQRTLSGEVEYLVDRRMKELVAESTDE